MARFVELASSAEVTFIPVLHALGQPGFTIFIYRLEASKANMKGELIPQGLKEWFWIVVA